MCSNTIPCSCAWFYGLQLVFIYMSFVLSLCVVCCNLDCLMFCLYHVDKQLLVLFCTMYIQLYISIVFVRKHPYTGSVLLVQPFPCDKSDNNNNKEQNPAMCELCMFSQIHPITYYTLVTCNHTYALMYGFLFTLYNVNIGGFS